MCALCVCVYMRVCMCVCVGVCMCVCLCARARVVIGEKSLVELKLLGELASIQNKFTLNNETFIQLLLTRRQIPYRGSPQTLA